MGELNDGFRSGGITNQVGPVGKERPGGEGGEGVGDGGGAVGHMHHHRVARRRTVVHDHARLEQLGTEGDVGQRGEPRDDAGGVVGQQRRVAVHARRAVWVREHLLVQA